MGHQFSPSENDREGKDIYIDFRSPRGPSVSHCTTFLVSIVNYPTRLAPLALQEAGLDDLVNGLVIVATSVLCLSGHID